MSLLFENESCDETTTAVATNIEGKRIVAYHKNRKQYKQYREELLKRELLFSDEMLISLLKEGKCNTMFKGSQNFGSKNKESKLMNLSFE